MEIPLNELKDLIAFLRAEELARKEKEKRDAWTKYVSLSMIFLAVLAAVATQRGAGSSSATMKLLNEATFNQASASDQWAYYQAKGIKQSLYELERDRLKSTGAPDVKALAGVESQAERYDREKKEITAMAKGYEEKRETARAAALKASEAGRAMGVATSVFQIAIALGGITLVVKKRWLWYSSLLAGALATAQMIHVLVAG